MNFFSRVYLALLIGSAWAGGVDFSLPDANGKIYTGAEVGRHKATVFIFVATECPNSNTYAPLLARLDREYAPRGVAFFNVYSDPADNAAAVRKHDSDFKTPFRALLDAHQKLARQTGARSTPEAIILGPGGEQLYRGRIDNRFIAVGKTRYQPTENDLQEALDAILAGKAVPHPVTRTIGCAIPGVE